MGKAFATLLRRFALTISRTSAVTVGSRSVALQAARKGSQLLITSGGKTIGAIRSIASGTAKAGKRVFKAAPKTTVAAAIAGAGYAAIQYGSKRTKTKVKQGLFAVLAAAAIFYSLTG